MNIQENVNVKININTSNATRSIVDLRREFKEVSKAMQDAIDKGDKIKQQDLAPEYTRLSGEIKKVETHLNSLNPGALMEGFVNLASGAVGAMSAITGAFMLFGDENERIQELEQKSMALIQTMMGLHEARTILISAESQASMKAMTQTIAMRYKKISAQLTDTLSIQANTKASKLATAAQKLWNKAIAANPIVALVAAVAALTTGIVVLAKNMTKISEEAEKQNRIRKATIEVNNAAIKSYASTEVKLRSYQKIVNDTTKTEEERYAALEDIKETTNGVVTATDLSVDSLKDLNIQTEDYIDNAYDVAMAQAAIELATDALVKKIKAESDIEQFKPGFWDSLWIGFKNSLNIGSEYDRVIQGAIETTELMTENQQEAVSEAEQLYQTYMSIAEEYTSAISKQIEAEREALEEERKRRKEEREKEEAERRYLKLLEDRKAAIKDLERVVLELRLAEAKHNKDYKKELEITKQIEELNYKERLDKYKKQLEERIITQEQYDSVEALLKKEHTNNLEEIDNEYEADKLAVQERINEEIRSDMENEIAAAEEKYRVLKEDAILYGLDITELETALQEELKAIREKYADEEIAGEAALNEHKINLERSRYSELWKLRMGNAKTIEEWKLAATESSKIEEEAALETARLSYESELELYKDDEEKKKEVTESYEELKTEITQKAENERENIRKEATQRGLDNAAAIMGRMSEMTNALMEAELEAAGDNEEKKKEIKKKYAVSQAMISIAQIGIDTALAIMGSFKIDPIGILAGIIGITGAAQIAMALIEANKIKSMRRGGLITGPSHENGGVLRELEGGEAVINKNSMAMPGVPAMISAINQAGGGVPIGTTSVSKSGAAPAIAAKIDESALDAIVTKVTQSIAAIPVMVSEVDITETQRRVEVIESKTIFG